MGFAEYLNAPENLFVFSSDFCHWGTRFSYTHYNARYGDIHEAIAALDKEGMRLIEDQDAAGFSAYQREFGNTICGQHPISLLLQALAVLGKDKHAVKFVHYSQSSRCRSL